MPHKVQVLIIICVITIAAIVGVIVTAIASTEDSGATIASILGFASTIIASMIVLLKIEKTDQTVDKIHILTNSNMGIQLESNMTLTEWKANQTKKPEDIEAAKRAKMLHEEHVKQQAIIDRQS